MLILDEPLNDSTLPAPFDVADAARAVEVLAEDTVPIALLLLLTGTLAEALPAAATVPVGTEGFRETSLGFVGVPAVATLD